MLKRIILRIASTIIIIIGVIALIYSFPHNIKLKNIETIEVIIDKDLDIKEYYVSDKFEKEFIKELNNLRFKRYFGTIKAKSSMVVIITYKDGKKIEVDSYKRIITNKKGKQKVVYVKCGSEEAWNNFINKYFEKRINEK